MLNNHLRMEPGDEAIEKSTKHRLSLVYVHVHWKSVVDIGVQPKHLAGMHVHKTHTMDTYTLYLYK